LSAIREQPSPAVWHQREIRDLALPLALRFPDFAARALPRATPVVGAPLNPGYMLDVNNLNTLSVSVVPGS
jgi:hypothetical protein